MNAMELLEARRSVGKLTEPAPSPETLERVVAAALRAPDHGALRPWSVLVVPADRRAAFGELLAQVERAVDPTADEAKLEAARRKALRAPLLLVVVCTVKPSPKAPEIEQLLSAGCVAHGLLLGLQAEGFGAIWRTGAPAYDAGMRAGLGLAESDRIVGILYVGTPAGEPPAAPRPAVRDHLRVWSG
jgi:nitroreductase